MDRSRYAVLVATVAVVAAVAAVAAGAATAVAASPGSATADVESQDFADIDEDGFETDRTRFLITTYANGSADWTFRYEQRLETDEDIEDFGGFSARFTETETDAYVEFQSRAESLAASGESATDREMAAGGFDRDAYIEERPPAGTEFGVVEMTFRWDGFADVEATNVTVGDVFVGGLYVGPEDELRFEAGPGLAFETVDPEPDSMAAGTLAESETVTWVGEREFTDRRPRLVHTERASTPGEQDGDETPVPDDNGSWLVPLAALLVVVLAGASAIAYQTGTFPRRNEQETDASGAGTSPADGTAERDKTATGGVGGEQPADGATTAASEPAVTDEMLQPDEQRVVDLLEQNGGRMKQVAIVDETDWSKSKVSMLLSEMENEGTISKLRVGRENIVSLAGHEPEAAGSPFDGESNGNDERGEQ